MPGRPVPKAAEIRPSKGEQKAAVYRARTRVAGGPESELSRLRDRGQVGRNLIARQTARDSSQQG